MCFLQIVFHACIAKQESSFDDRDVTTAVCEKMIRRHPHVFGNVSAKTPNDVKVKWEEIKREEKSVVNHSEVLKGVSRNLPALMRSEKVQDKAAQVALIGIVLWMLLRRCLKKQRNWMLR